MLVAILGVALFALAYITKRRFGVLGLALAAGAVLSANWSTMLTPFLMQHGIHLTSLPLDSVVKVGLIILPPALLLFSGPVYNKMPARVIGSTAFALLALAFCADTLQTIAAGTTNADILQQLHDNQSFIIVAGLLGALVDVLLSGKAKSKERKKAKD